MVFGWLTAQIGRRGWVLTRWHGYGAPDLSPAGGYATTAVPLTGLDPYKRVGQPNWLVLLAYLLVVIWLLGASL
jgi:hypothetical protein